MMCACMWTKSAESFEYHNQLLDGYVGEHLGSFTSISYPTTSAIIVSSIEDEKSHSSDKLIFIADIGKTT
ncbi:unnamed protein product [Periconia digitata]|uniref:Uncharacterized protein n=1 Tax=Periconia digitata TaxID=1303443 RepID=A0A9W4UMJ7_9PLEO|nr:unnamed protein product [Periconia digitata]